MSSFKQLMAFVTGLLFAITITYQINPIPLLASGAAWAISIIGDYYDNNSKD